MCLPGVTTNQSHVQKTHTPASSRAWGRGREVLGRPVHGARPRLGAEHGAQCGPRANQGGVWASEDPRAEILSVWISQRRGVPVALILLPHRLQVGGGPGPAPPLRKSPRQLPCPGQAMVPSRIPLNNRLTFRLNSASLSSHPGAHLSFPVPRGRCPPCRGSFRLGSEAQMQGPSCRPHW